MYPTYLFAYVIYAGLFTEALLVTTENYKQHIGREELNNDTSIHGVQCNHRRE